MTETSLGRIVQLQVQRSVMKVKGVRYDPAPLLPIEEAAIGPLCIVSSGARVGARTLLWGQVYVGEAVSIGDDSVIYPMVSIRERCHVGSRVILHNGAVIGSDGFGFSVTPDGWKKIEQTGCVIVEDDAEIGANTTIDRARFGVTRIGCGAKLDNLVQVAHNVEVGPGCAFAAQVGLAGSCKIGAGTQMGGQAGAVGHVKVGERSIVVAKAAVAKDCASGEVIMGFPGRPQREEMKAQAALRRLPALRERVSALEAQISALEEKLREQGRKGE